MIEVKEKIKYIDYLNVFACLSVIALHCNGCFWNFSYERYWKTSVIIETLCYCAVPIFFMIIGVTLLNYRQKYNTATFIKKRAKKIVMPWLCWSLIAILFNVLNGSVVMDKITFKFLLDALINSKYMTVYWFFIPLFSVYLSLPFISLIPQNVKIKIYGYAAVYSFITISILPVLFQLIGVSFNNDLTTLVSGGYILYVLLGYLIAYGYHINLRQRLVIYFLGFCGWALRAYTVYTWSLTEGKIINIMGGYLNFPTVLFSVAVFIFFKYDLLRVLGVGEDNVYKIIRMLSGHSFAVYLLHMYFVIYLPKIFAFKVTSIYFRTLGVLAVYILCIVTSLAIKKVLYLKNILP